MFPRLRRRGAIAVTQGRVVLSTRADHLLTKAAGRAAAEYVIRNRAPHLDRKPLTNAAAGTRCRALRCAALLATLLTQTEAQSGFYHVVSLAVGATQTPATGFVPATPQMMCLVSGSHLFLNGVNHTWAKKRPLRKPARSAKRHGDLRGCFLLVGLPVRIAVELINGGY